MENNDNYLIFCTKRRFKTSTISITSNTGHMYIPKEYYTLVNSNYTTSNLSVYNNL